MDSRLSDSLNRKDSAFSKMKAELPVLIGNMGVGYWLNAFKQQGWEGVRWQEVQRRISGTFPYKYPKTKDKDRHSRAILIGFAHSKSGLPHLRQSVSTSLKSKVWDNITWSVPQQYAERHNEGIKMPKRQFIGFSPKFKNNVSEQIIKALKKVSES